MKKKTKGDHDLLQSEVQSEVESEVSARTVTVGEIKRDSLITEIH